MTDHTNAELIAASETWTPAEVHASPVGAARIIESLAAALETAEQRAKEAERELQVAEDQANNLAGDLAQAEKERDRLDEAFDRDLPWRYDEVEAQRNQLAAVVERVRAARAKHPACEKHPDGDPISCGWKGAVLDIDAALATAPDDALREVKAAVWAEGFEAGWAEKEDPGAFVNDVWDAKTPNPYREEER